VIHVRAWRVDYADGTSWYSHQGPPQRTTDVLAVVGWGDPPYRTLAYGRWDDPVAVVDGVELSGVTIDDDDWERYRLALHAEPHALEVGDR
jgi:hypothetical protein